MGFGINDNANMPPDPEIVLRAWLLSKTSITDEVSTRISTRLPSSPTLPFIVISNNGNSLLDPSSQSAINIADMTMIVYAGRWGSDGTKSEPDFTTASNIAQIIFKEAFTEGQIEVTTGSGVKALIYDFEVQVAPTRIEQRDIQVAQFQVSVAMTYRYTE